MLQPSTYWDPHNPSLSILCSADEDGAKQQTNRTQQAAHTEEQLCPSRNLDPQLGLGAHGLGVRLSVRQEEVAVRVLVEVHQRTVLLLLGWGWHATGHSHSLGVERVRDVVHRLPLRRRVEVGLPAAHNRDYGRQGMTAFLTHLQEGKRERSLSTGMLAMNTWVARGSGELCSKYLVARTTVGCELPVPGCP